MNKRKKRILALVLAAILLAAVCVGVILWCNAPQTFEASYLGVRGYGTVKRAEVLDPNSAIYRFSVDGREQCYRIDCGAIYADSIPDGERQADKGYFKVLPAEDGAYPIQNLLREGETYRLTAEDDTILSCEALTRPGTFTPIVTGTPGKHTLKNFLQTGLMPAGNVLYVYGGGWDWQDIGSSEQARSIGVSELWTDAFTRVDAGYCYRDEAHPSETTFPFGEWNQYYYLGLDCSAFVGWTLYNTIYDESLTHPGFVRPACDMAKMLAEDYDFGTWSHTETELRPGDVVSTAGHVWICVGCCPDGSAVTVESNITPSCTGVWGGGVHLCAVSPKGENDRTCAACELVSSYMETYYPQWAERYPTTVFDRSKAMSFSDDPASTGVFHWNITEDPGTAGGLADPEGLASMDAEAILTELFRDAAATTEKR